MTLIKKNLQVDLGSLKDTVPTDRIVALQGGWRPFGDRFAGEILLRLTYKGYVEDDEDEAMAAKLLDTDVSDDEMFDSDDIYATYEQRERDFSNGTDKETFMDVLAALLVSEEFQGIVASETGNTRSSDDITTSVSTSSSVGPNTETVAPNSKSGNQTFIGTISLSFFSELLNRSYFWYEQKNSKLNVKKLFLSLIRICYVQALPYFGLP